MAQVVVLLHGMSRTRLSLSRIEKDLVRAGYRVVNRSYPSWTASIEEHARKLRALLRDLDEDAAVDAIHLVTHSLGGIIARCALVADRPKKIGRVVMLAPPNGGSSVARRLGRFFGGLIRPLRQLSDEAASFVNSLPSPAGVQIGIIAAARDAKVPVQSSHLAGETDHLVVGGFHTFIMERRDVRRQTEAFLRTGRFLRA